MKGYARLDEGHFKKLVAGEHVTVLTGDGREIEIMLADIGWGRIYAAVEAARDRRRSGRTGRWRCRRM